MTPTRADAYDLMHGGAIVCAQVESNGIKVDVPYLDATMADIDRQVVDMEAELTGGKIWTRWKAIFGDKAKLGSGLQLAHMVFKELGFDEVKDRTTTGLMASGKTAFEHVDHPFIQKYFRIKTIKNMKATFLNGIKKELCNGYIYPIINPNIPRTYRFSYNMPNWQNNPNRDPEQAALVRRCFISRHANNHVVEDDLIAAEVRVAGCYNGDERLIEDTINGDMHRDTACQLFKLTPKQVSKVVRRISKSFFVFAEFYGDYYLHCAKNIWAAIVRENPVVHYADGDVPLKQHLKDKRIGVLGACDPDRDAEPGTFEYHVKQVEDQFWNKTYTTYTQWKKDWYEQYQRRGYFDMLTGFRVEGYHKRNDVVNYPIQGASFHCILWAMIRLQNWLNKYKMQTKILGQIHDSIVSDVPANELQDYLYTVDHILTVALPKAWPWITVPLKVEVEVAPVGLSWFDKKEWVPGSSGLWAPKV